MARLTADALNRAGILRSENFIEPARGRCVPVVGSRLLIPTVAGRLGTVLAPPGRLGRSYALGFFPPRSGGGCRLPPLRAASAPPAVSQIRNKLSLSFKSLGEMNYKNIPQPVRTFAIAEADGVALYAAHQQKNNDDDED